MKHPSPLIVFAAVSAIACSGASGSAPPTDASTAQDTPVVTDVPSVQDTPPPPTDTSAPSDASGAFTMTPYRSDAPERSFSEAEMVLQAGRDYRAIIETDVGAITLDLFEQETPITVNSFVFLALHHYFDGLAFHRVLEGFVAQGGDPLTADSNRARWGTGGPGYMFDTETVPSLTFDAAGVLGMARSTARNSNGSQFFITLAATTNLNGQYTVFGRVTEGLDVLDRIARNPNQNTPPTTPTRMTRVVIQERAR